MTDVPYAHTSRPDTGVSNARLGMWLFLASDVMFMASLLSAHVLLRASATSVPEFPFSWTRTVAATTMLLLAALSLHPLPGRNRIDRRNLLAGGIGALAFVFTTLMHMAGQLAIGVTPASNVLIASWFTLTAAHVLHVAAGACSLAWIGFQLDRSDTPQMGARLEAIRMYWYVVVATWIVLVVILTV